jgi:hypothetical protein
MRSGRGDRLLHKLKNWKDISSLCKMGREETRGMLLQEIYKIVKKTRGKRGKLMIG